jgi:hypothetical protein
VFSVTGDAMDKDNTEIQRKKVSYVKRFVGINAGVR